MNEQFKKITKPSIDGFIDNMLAIPVNERANEFKRAVSILYRAYAAGYSVSLEHEFELIEEIHNGVLKGYNEKIESEKNEHLWRD